MIQLTINGKPARFDGDPDMPLLWYLRDELALSYRDAGLHPAALAAGLIVCGLFGEREIRLMKPGSFLLNNARGQVVDLEALAAALHDRHLLGAAIDVFPAEPRSNKERFETPLQGLDNVILTPHIGGSTAEAQDRIGVEVARKLIAYSDVGATLGAVNFPEVQLPSRPRGTRFMHVHRNAPGILRRINEIFSEAGANIAAQFLQTDGELGYVVVEAETQRNEDMAILARLRELDGTIRARLLYQR